MSRARLTLEALPGSPSVCARQVPAAATSSMPDEERLEQGRKLMASDTETQKTGSFRCSQRHRRHPGFPLRVARRLPSPGFADNIQEGKGQPSPCISHQPHQTCPPLGRARQAQQDVVGCSHKAQPTFLLALLLPRRQALAPRLLGGPERGLDLLPWWPAAPLAEARQRGRLFECPSAS